jgi:hypothetical protein
MNHLFWRTYFINIRNRPQTTIVLGIIDMSIHNRGLLILTLIYKFTNCLPFLSYVSYEVRNYDSATTLTNQARLALFSSYAELNKEPENEHSATSNSKRFQYVIQAQMLLEKAKFLYFNCYNNVKNNL